MDLRKIDKKQILADFLIAVSEGCAMMEAGKKAGVSHPEAFIARELHNPDFLPAMAVALRHRLGGALALKAMNVAEQMLNSKNTSPRIRWDIAKTILAAGAGFVPPKAKELEAPQKDISQMSGDDIMQLRRSLEAEMVNRANASLVIDHTPQPLDFLD